MINSKKKFFDMFIREDGFKKAAEYSDILEVSSKTVYNYLNELELLLKQYDLQIEKKSGKGITLKGTKEEKSRLLSALAKEMALSVQERRNQIYEDLLMRDMTLSINTLADAYYVSRSSIVNDFETIEELLSEKNLCLSKTKAGTCVSGDESRIRRAKIDFVYKKIEDTLLLTDDIIKNQVEFLLKKYCDEESVEIAREMISYIGNELYFDFNIIYYLQLLIRFTIFVQRIKDGHPCVREEKKPAPVALHELKTYPIVQQMLTYVSYDLHREINQIDVNYINRAVNAVYKDENDLIGIKNEDVVEEITAQMIDSIKDIFTNDISTDTLLLNGLNKHVKNLFYRLKDGINVTNPYLEQIKKQYAAMFSVVSLACSIIENALEVTLSEDEISYILIHFQAAVERAAMCKKIVIVVESRDIYSTLLESDIRKSFVLFDVVEIIERKNTKIEYINEFDFAVTTMKIEGISIPHIQISSVVSQIDIQHIQKAYSDYRISTSERYTFIKQCLSENTVLLQKDFQSNIECLRYVSSLMYEEGCVDEKFFESVLKREMITPTNVTEDIALPHGMDKHVLKNRIAIITTPKPLAWGDGSVSIIFLLAVNFSKASVAKKMLGELYSFISEKTGMERLKNCKTYEEVLELLK